jgi:hypothetical protein
MILPAEHALFYLGLISQFHYLVFLFMLRDSINLLLACDSCIQHSL